MNGGAEGRGGQQKNKKRFFSFPLSLGSSRRRATASLATALLDQQPRLLPLRRQLDVAREPQHLQRPDHHPRHVELALLQAVASGELERVVVVVPPLAKGQDADEPVVAREVSGVVGLGAPHVADAVDEPGDLWSFGGRRRRRKGEREKTE